MASAFDTPVLPGEKVLWISFNQDRSRFVFGTTQGFRVFYTSPLEDAFSRCFRKGIGIVEVLDSTNIVALVGGGNDPYLPPNDVGIWNDYQARMIDVMKFKERVCNVKLGRTDSIARLVVATETSVTGFNLLTLTKTFRIPTVPNPRGLCPFSVSKSCVASFPAECVGKLGFHVEDAETLMAEILPPFDVHESALVAVALSSDGKLVAAAAEKAGHVRVFDIESEEKTLEFHRDDEVSSLAFSDNGKYLAVATTRGECQVYATDDKEAMPGNPKQSGLKGMFFSPVYRMATITIPKVKKAVVKFISNSSTVVVVTEDSTVTEAEVVEAGPTLGYEIKHEPSKLLSDE